MRARRRAWQNRTNSSASSETVVASSCVATAHRLTPLQHGRPPRAQRDAAPSPRSDPPMGSPRRRLRTEVPVVPVAASRPMVRRRGGPAGRALSTEHEATCPHRTGVRGRALDADVDDPRPRSFTPFGGPRVPTRRRAPSGGPRRGRGPRTGRPRAGGSRRGRPTPRATRRRRTRRCRRASPPCTRGSAGSPRSRARSEHPPCRARARRTSRASRSRRRRRRRARRGPGWCTALSSATIGSSERSWSQRIWSSRCAGNGCSMSSTPRRTRSGTSRAPASGSQAVFASTRMGPEKTARTRSSVSRSRGPPSFTLRNGNAAARAARAATIVGLIDAHA